MANSPRSCTKGLSAFTPGPWRIGRSHPSQRPFWIAQDGGNGGETKGVLNSGCFSRASTDEAEANARLIAAAPDLLEALENMLAISNNITTEAVAARHVIAKVRGESEQANSNATREP